MTRRFARRLRWACRRVGWGVALGGAAGLTAIAGIGVAAERWDIDLPAEMSAPPETPLPTPAGCSPGVVTSVVDGDTIDVGGCRVRLLGVDTPETQWRRRGTPWCADYALGREATRAVEALTLGKAVTFGRAEDDSSGRDMAAEVVLPDGVDLGAWLVANGYAVTWPAATPADACPPGRGPGMEPNR